MHRKFLNWLSFNFRYFWDVPWDTGITPPELVDFIKSSSPGRALDLGAGTGTNVINLAKAGWKAFGIEFALPAVIIAKRKIKRAGVDAKIYFHDVTDLDFLTTGFDLILDIGCFHSLNPVKRLLYRNNLLRWLKPGGTYLLYGFVTNKTDDFVGISEEEIKLFSRLLEKQSVVRGTERELRDSVWLKFRKIPE